jgi:hypothetical protein
VSRESEMRTLHREAESAWLTGWRFGRRHRFLTEAEAKAEASAYASRVASTTPKGGQDGE